MSPPLVYTPAYWGLLFALIFALACNAFLDIQYGGFGREVAIWALVFAFALRVGWRQRGIPSDQAKSIQKKFLIAGALFSVLVFIPMWGFPRAGLYMLAALQAANNCVTTSRRQLHLGLLVSLIMVMFAATHYRADWTMLFYLIPYVTAVVFTLVADQINRHSDELRSRAIGTELRMGQGLAIASATAVIMAVGGILYFATPQPTWLYLKWRYGQVSATGFLHDAKGQGLGGNSGSGGQGQQSLLPGAGEVPGHANPDPDGSIPGLSAGSRWPSVEEMRKAMKRPGIPAWQAATIGSLANLQEWGSTNLSLIKKQMKDVWEALKEWMHEHRQSLVRILAALVLLATIAALIVFLREVKALAWIRVRVDYLRLAVMALHARGDQGAREYYSAMERLFSLHDAGRPACANTREYLAYAGRRFGSARDQIAELTLLFESVRYGDRRASEAELDRMRQLYRHIWRTI